MNGEDPLLTFERSFGCLMTALSFIGYNRHRHNWPIMGCLSSCLVFATTLLIFAFCMYFLYMDRRGVDVAIFNLLFTVNTFTCLCKATALIIHKASFEDLISFFDTELPVRRFNDVTINEMAMKRFTEARVWAIVLFISNFAILTIIILMAVFWPNKENDLPIAVSYQLTDHYILEFCIQTVGYTYEAVTASIFDSFYLTCCLFITAQLEVLIRELDMIECPPGTSPVLVRKQLINVLEKQSLIIRANALFNTCFGLPLFIQLFVSTVGICFATIHLQNLSSVMMIPPQLLQITLFCYFGQKITDKSGALANAFYGTPWINMRPAERKWILIGLRQAQKPLYSKAGPLRNMSHESLKSVFQTAYSFYAVLKEIDN